MAPRSVPKLKHDSDHLQIFMMIYAVLFTFGLDHIFNLAYETCSPKVILTAAAIIFIGLRLIYTPEALSQHLLGRLQINAPMDPRWVVFVHYPIMVGQAALIHLAAYQFSLSEKMSLDDILFRAIVLGILTIGVNSVWLFVLVRQSRKDNLPRNKFFGAEVDSESEILVPYLHPPRFWIINNLCFGALAAIALFWLVVGLGWNEYGILVADLFLLSNTCVDYAHTAKWYVPRIKIE